MFYFLWGFFLVSCKYFQLLSILQGSGPLCDFMCTLLLQLHFNSFPDSYLVYSTHIMHHGEVSTVSYMVWLHLGQDEHQRRSWVQLQQQNCTENRIVVQSLYPLKNQHHWFSCAVALWADPVTRSCSMLRAPFVLMHMEFILTNMLIEVLIDRYPIFW